MVTADRYPVGTVVCVQDKAMKQAWCLAASSPDATAKQLTGLYGRRWGIRPGMVTLKTLRGRETPPRWMRRRSAAADDATVGASLEPA